MEIVLFGAFLAFYLMFNVYENYFREKERFNAMPGAGTLWHTHQWLGWITAFGFVAFQLFPDVWLAARVLLFSSAVWWIMYSGWLNALKNRFWFYRSLQSSSTFEKLASIEIKLLFLFAAGLLMLLGGCSPAVRYVDRVTVDTVVVVPPTIIKELPAVTVTDTVVIGHEIVKTDTVVTVKYFPREQRFDLMVKPDTVKLLMVDTVEVTQVLPDPEPETPIWVWFVSIGGIIGVLYIFLRKR